MKISNVLVAIISKFNGIVLTWISVMNCQKHSTAFTSIISVSHVVVFIYIFLFFDSWSHIFFKNLFKFSNIFDEKVILSLFKKTFLLLCVFSEDEVRKCLITYVWQCVIMVKVSGNPHDLSQKCHSEWPFQQGSCLLFTSWMGEKSKEKLNRKAQKLKKYIFKFSKNIIWKGVSLMWGFPEIYPVFF